MEKTEWHSLSGDAKELVFSRVRGHSQFCITLNLTWGGGGLVCDVNESQYTSTACLLEVLNLFVGKARHYSHDCSWDAPGSGVDRILCWVYVETFDEWCGGF